MAFTLLKSIRFPVKPGNEAADLISSRFPGSQVVCPTLNQFEFSYNSSKLITIQLILLIPWENLWILVFSQGIST